MSRISYPLQIVKLMVSVAPDNAMKIGRIAQNKYGRGAGLGNVVFQYVLCVDKCQILEYNLMRLHSWLVATKAQSLFPYNLSDIHSHPAAHPAISYE